MDKAPSPESSPDRWVSVRRPRPALVLRVSESDRPARRRRRLTPRSPSDSPPPCRSPPRPINPNRWGNLRRAPSLPSTTLVPTEARVSPSLPSPSPACPPTVSPEPTSVVGALPKNWPKHMVWGLPFYPTEEEWARAERAAKKEMRAEGMDVSSSSEEE